MSLTLCLCCCSVAKLCLTLRLHGLQHSRLFCPSLSPGVCSDSCPLIWWCFLTIASSDTYLCVWCVYIHIYKCIYASNILWKNGGGEAEGIKILVVYWNDILADRSHIWLNSLLVAGEKSSLALAEAMCDLTISPHRWGEVFSISAWGHLPQSGPGGVRVSHWAFCTEPAAPLLLPLPLVPRVEGPLVTDTWLQTERHPLVFSIIFRFRGDCVPRERGSKDSFDSWKELLLLLVPAFVPWYGFFSLLHCYAADCRDCDNLWLFHLFFSPVHTLQMPAET